MSGYARYPHLGVRLITGGDGDDELSRMDVFLMIQDDFVFKVTNLDQVLEYAVPPREIRYIFVDRREDEPQMRLVLLALIMRRNWFTFVTGRNHLLWKTMKSSRQRNNLHMLRLLLERGANIEDATYSGTFSVEKYKRSEVTVNMSTGHVLHDCVKNFDKSMLQVLIEHGVDVNARNSHGDTALQTCLAILMQRTWPVKKTFKIVKEAEKQKEIQDRADFCLSTVKLLIENGATIQTEKVFESTSTDEYKACCAYPILFMLAVAGRVGSVRDDMRPSWLGTNNQIHYDLLPPAYLRYASMELRDEIVAHKFPAHTMYQGSEGFEIITLQHGKHLISYREPGVGWLRNDIEKEILFLADNRALCEIAASCRKMYVESCETLHLWTNQPLRMLKIEDWRNEFCSTKLQAPGDNYFVDESILKQFCLSKGCHGWIAAAKFDNDVDWGERLFEYAIFPQYVKADENLVLTDGFVGGQGQLDPALYNKIRHFQRGRFPWREAHGTLDPHNPFFQLGARFLRFTNCKNAPTCDLHTNAVEMKVEPAGTHGMYNYQETTTSRTIEDEKWTNDVQFLEWAMLTDYLPQVRDVLKQDLFHRPTEVVELYMRFEPNWMNVTHFVDTYHYRDTSEHVFDNVRVVRQKMKRGMELKQTYRQDTWPKSMPVFYFHFLDALQENMHDLLIGPVLDEFCYLLEDVLRYRNMRTGYHRWVTRDKIIETVQASAKYNAAFEDKVRPILEPYVSAKRAGSTRPATTRPAKKRRLDL